MSLKIYLWINVDRPGHFEAHALSEDGVFLHKATVASLQEVWPALESPEAQEKYRAHAESYELERVPCQDVRRRSHRGFEAAWRKWCASRVKAEFTK